MATILERERPSGVLIERQDESTGWAVAAVIIIALLAVGAFVWARYYATPTPAQTNTPGTNINVTLPQSGGAQAPQTPSGATQPQTNTTY